VSAYTPRREVLAGILRRCRANLLNLEKDDCFFAAVVIGSSVLSSLSKQEALQPSELVGITVHCVTP